MGSLFEVGSLRRHMMNHQVSRSEVIDHGGIFVYFMVSCRIVTQKAWDFCKWLILLMKFYPFLLNRN